MKKIIILSSATVALLFSISSFVAKQPKENTTVTTNTNQELGTATRWTLDRAHSNVKFSVSHLVVSDVEGSFRLIDGSMEHSAANYSDAIINFTIDVASINTDNEMRDKHLKSDDFFNVEKYPTIKFQSTSFKPLGGIKYKLTGNLTIRDVTKPVTFDVTYGGTANAMGKTKAGFKAKTTINRFDYNIKFDRVTETGGLVAGKDVEITVNVEMDKS